MITTNYEAMGGGIHLPQGLIRNNIICQNSIAAPICRGGGIFNTSKNVPIRFIAITRNQISNNVLNSTGYPDSAAGAGISLQAGSNAHIMNNEITYNKLSAPSHCHGAGVSLFESTAPTLVQDNNISFNSVISGVCWGGGLYAKMTIGITIQGNCFEGNNGHNGGGISGVQTHGSIISDNIFIQNNASHGGGMFFDNSTPYVYNNIIFQNQASQYGGGFCSSNYIGTPQIINNTIVGNTANIGGGISAEYMSPKILNTIIWGNLANTIPQIYTFWCTPEAAYSNIQGDTILIGEGNISKEPMLRGESFELSDSSSCIGAGKLSYQFGSTTVTCPYTCFLGQPRPSPSGSNPDMGACESLLGSPVVGLENQLSDNIPKTYDLKQNYPNPFNPNTTIEFDLPKSSKVTLKIFNILGEEVITLISDKLSAGSYSYEWDASNLASGVYLYRLQAGDYVETRKMVLMR
jgi:hypothetical protein